MVYIKRKAKDTDVKKRREVRPKKSCVFCKKSVEIDYKNIDLLSKFLSTKRKITSRRFSGNCAKHQRKLVRQIKRARFLSLLHYSI